MTKLTPNEVYELEIPEEGLSYDILEMAFDPTTKEFIKLSGIAEGMRVLDVGSGSGSMTNFLAEKVGPTGQVVAIDNSEQQLGFAKRYCEEKGHKNILFKHVSLFDLEKLNMTFDFIYCRFVLHHVHQPKKAIQLFYNLLNTDGTYLAEEGIICSAFSYPPCSSWWHERSLASVIEDKEGKDRDGEFGMKLFHSMKTVGFAIEQVKLIQPVFINYEQKIKLLQGHEAYKKTALAQGKTEKTWQQERESLIALAKDDTAMVAFYQSCQVLGIKQ